MADPSAETAPFSAALIADLRTDLRVAGYTVDRVRALWGVDAEAALTRGVLAPARLALGSAQLDSDHTAIATLARVFLLDETLPEAELAAALPALGAAGAEQLGLILRADGVVRAALDLRPYTFTDSRGTAEWWLASDLGELALGHELPPEHVLGVGGASLTLSGLMLQDAVGSVLDLGTGCGIQAMHASRFAERVVATDISARALRMAQLNVALNDIEGVEFRAGSLFEPVARERFDRIVSNPPFVITPRNADVPGYEYRDGGLVGDAIVRAVVGGAGEHLNPGGIAQFLGNWEYHGGGPAGDGLARVRAWADASETPVDAWVIERDVQNPADYAETWIRDGGTRPGTPAFERLCVAWITDFARRGVDRVGFGFVLLRRTAATPRRRFEHLDGPIGWQESALGVHVRACLDGWDVESWLDDDTFAALRLRTAPDVTEERHYWPGEENPVRIMLRQGGGFARSVDADAALAGFVGACDGELSAGAIVSALASLLEVPDGELRDQLLPRIRELMDIGMLLPFTAGAQPRSPR